MEQLRNEKMAQDGGGRRLDCDRERGGGGGGGVGRLGSL